MNSTKEHTPVPKKSGCSSKATCPICCEVVNDCAKGKSNGDESIFCDGMCQDWLHRQCAGLSKAAFLYASKSVDLFFCPCCINKQQSNEISLLKQELRTLSSNISSLKLMIDEKLQPIAPSIPSGKTTYAESVNLTSAAKPTVVSPRIATVASDRKFNVVIYGVAESTKGTFRNTRKVEDTQKVEDVISSLKCQVGPNSIRDCIRLGKYNHMAPRPRPMLVNLNRVTDVRNVLSQVRTLPKPYVIKPDLPYEKRRIDKILLRERWSLIQSGVQPSSIKIRNSSLFVSNVVFGSVSDFTFSRSNISLDENDENDVITPTLTDNEPDDEDLSTSSSASQLQ